MAILWQVIGDMRMSEMNVIPFPWENVEEEFGRSK